MTISPVLLRLGTRTSPLAMAQTHHVAALLKGQFPKVQTELVPIQTIGDQRLDKALGEIGDKGLFVKELETALLANEIDLAIHSYKDMPTQNPEGLTVVPVAQREIPWDVWVGRDGISLKDLPQGARVGTSSIRRVNCLKHHRPDVETFSVRGNVNTRLRKLAEGEVDGLILAGAGLTRLGFDVKITETLSMEVGWLPAPAQGILAAQYRTDDSIVAAMVAAIQDEITVYQAQAERGALQAMESGCHVPFAAYSHIAGNEIHLTVAHFHPDQAQQIRLEATDSVSRAQALGQRLGETMRAQLTEVRSDVS